MLGEPMATRRSRSADLATKADLQAVGADLRGVESKLSAEIERVESKLSAEIERVESKLSAEIRANGVVLERVESKLTAMSEGFQSVAVKSEVKAVDDRESRSAAQRFEAKPLGGLGGGAHHLDRLSGRVSLLEDVARQHSEDIRLLRATR